MTSNGLLQAAYFTAHAGTALLAGALAYWARWRTELPAKRWFSLWMADFMLWSLLSAALVVITVQPIAFLLFMSWAFVGLTAILLTVYFGVAYSGRRPRTNRLAQLATLVYVPLAILLITGPFHDLYWASVMFLETPFPHFSAQPGPGWGFAIIFVTFAVGVLVYYFAELYFRARRRQRDALLVIVLGLVLGLVPMLLSAFDILLLPTYDHTAFAGTLNALAFGYAVFRFGTTPVASIAREETLDTLDDPYLALDTQYRLVDFNDATQRVFDAVSASRIGTPLEEIAPQLAEVLCSSDGLTAPSELFSRVHDGTTKHYRVHVSPVAEWDSPRGYALVLTDVTDLEESRQVVRQQNERLDAFAGTISHDLRNPLHVASARLELLKEEYDSEHLAPLDRALTRMEDLIETLLMVARGDDELTELDRVDLAEVTRECWQTVETGNATLNTDVDRVIHADRSRLRQLFENLYRNAVEHGGDDVTVWVGERDDGFYVADDGPGIPDATRDEVFALGYSSKTDGTGLGLHIVKQIVEAHDWEIQVTESTDGGTRFEITGVEFAD